MVLKLNKNFRYMALAITALLTIVSCKDKEPLDASVELSSDNVVLVSAISESSFSIRTEASWSIESSESWCQASPLSGTGSSLIKVKATSANTETTDRKAVLTLTVGNTKKTIDVTQKGFATISVSIPSVDVTYDTKTTSVDVESSEGWDIVPASLPSWVKADKMSTTTAGKTPVTFTLENNNTETNRQANIIFKITNKPDSVTFRISQYTIRGNGRMNDSLAVVAIYKNIDQPEHHKNFDFTKPLSQWTGVTLSLLGLEYRVTGLNIVSAATFTIPGTGDGNMIPDTRESCWKKNTPLPADIGYLEELRTLACGSLDYKDMQNVHAGISGQLPEALGKLTKLKNLSLQNNNFEGSLPSSMRNLTGLVELQLYNNKFSGELPTFIGEFMNLRVLNCSYNQFSPIPNAFSKLQSLTTMDLSFQGVYNKATDRYESSATFQFPSSLMQMKKLDTLYMIDCGLTGPLPTTLGNMVGLSELKAYNNDLSGNLPATIGEMPRLRILNLSNNKLDGSIPAEIGKCPYLAGLFLGGNNLIGSIPDELGKCPFLQVVELYDNKLTGQVTPAFLRGTSLYQLVLAGNDLEGTIPDEIANHKILAVLDISGNRFTGISNKISEANKDLQFLWAANNQLTALPQSLNLLLKLKDVDFSGNNIEGTIPESIGNIFKLERLLLNGNKLSGNIPENLLKHRNQSKFQWTTEICPQQAGFGFNNCPTGSSRAKRSVRR